MVKKISAWVYIALVLCFIYLPIATIMVYSFTTSKVIGTWTGFSFELYKELFVGSSSEAILQAFRNTIVLGLSAATISTFLGTIASIGIFTMKGSAKKKVLSLNQIPILNADIVTGVALMLFFVVLGVSRGFFTILIAHIVICTPFVVLAIMPKLKQMDGSLYEAACDLGAKPLQVIHKVIVPQILPGILSGFMLAFTLSIDDFVITIFNNGSFQTLSTYIYADAKKGGLTPSLRALSTLIFVFVLTMLLIVNIRKSKDEKKNK
ncbi:MAG: ABC transporter permease [Bacillota bacterium]